MKTMVNRITLRFICIVIFPLCLLALSGCAEEFGSEYIEIVSPADISSFESGDSITFEMLLTVKSREGNGIKKGTIIQWTSDRDGDFWREEVDHDIEGVKEPFLSETRYTASYSQSFSTSALSAGDHKITCKANATDESGTYNIATESIRIYISESQDTTTTTIAATTTTATTTTTTTDGGGNLDLTACTALDDLEVRAGEAKYYNNNTECWASIILKNNGMKAIHGGFYTDDSTINIIDPHEFGRDGWGFLYLDPGQEYENFIQPSGWGYQPQTDSHGNPLPIRTVITSKITAVYSEDGCMWILNEDLFSDGVIDAPIRTRDVSGLDPCN
jgi:hypothetical protein